MTSTPKDSVKDMRLATSMVGKLISALKKSYRRAIEWLFYTHFQHLFIQEIQTAQERGYRFGQADLRAELEPKLCVDPEEILSLSRTGQLLLGGHGIDESKLRNLKTEADYIERSLMWEVLQTTLKQRALEKAVYHSANYEQVLAGKMMLHSLELLQAMVCQVTKVQSGLEKYKGVV